MHVLGQDKSQVDAGLTEERPRTLQSCPDSHGQFQSNEERRLFDIMVPCERLAMTSPA